MKKTGDVVRLAQGGNGQRKLLLGVRPRLG